MKPEDDELDASLKRALSRDPGEPYFDTFAARVADRVAAAQAAEAKRAASAGAPWWRGLFASPRALAAVGGVAVLAVAAGVTLTLMRDRTRGPEALLETRALAPPAQVAPTVTNEVAPGAMGAAEGKGSSDAVTPSAPAPRTAATAPASPVTQKDAARAVAVQPQRSQEMRRSATGEMEPVPSEWRKRADARGATAPPEGEKPKSIVQLKREAIGPLATAPPPATRVEEPARAQRAPSPEDQPVAQDEAAARPAAERSGGVQPAPVDPSDLSAGGAASTGPSALAPGSPAAPRWGAVRALDRDVPRTGPPFAGEAPALQSRVEDAIAKTDAARRARKAPGWDVAAATWEELANALATDPARIEARWRAADARQRAWRAEPTPAREAAAGVAARAFAAAAPDDPRVRGLLSPTMPWGQSRQTYR